MIVLVDKKRFGSILAVMLAAFLVLCSCINFKKIKQSFYPQKYNLYVEKYAEEYGVDKLFVYSIIKAESNFEEEVLSTKGAVGLMQIMPQTAEEIAKKLELEEYSAEMLYQPETNIKIGCFYLGYLLEKYSGSYISAAAAYNAGHGNVDSWLAIWQTDEVSVERIPFGETKKYVEKVENYYNKYKELYKEE